MLPKEAMPTLVQARSLFRTYAALAGLSPTISTAKPGGRPIWVVKLECVVSALSESSQPELYHLVVEQFLYPLKFESHSYSQCNSIDTKCYSV